MDMDQQKKDLLEALSGAEKVLIGIGGEWRLRDDGRDVRLRSLGDPVQKELREAYAVLWSLVRDKDYYVVTTVTDGAVYDTDFDGGWWLPAEISIGGSVPKPVPRIYGKRGRCRMISALIAGHP